MIATLVAALSLAGSMAVDVPYLPQTDAMCGGAATAMVFRYWGDAHADVQEFAPLVDRSAGGIANDVLAAAVRTRGWRVATVGGSLEALRERIRDRQPVIVLLADRGTGYHYVVVTGWKRDAIVVHDPSWGPSRQIRDADFERLWRASNFWSMVILPSAVASSSVTPTEPLARSAQNIGGSSVAATCGAQLARAMSAIQAGGLDSADQLLDAVRAQCPHDGGPVRELSGVRFAQHRWAEAAALAREALRLDARDEYAIDVLGSSLFMEGDAVGALRAWNRIGKPRVNVVRIDGLHHSRYQTIADDVGIRANQLLTAEAFERAKRRLGELPSAASTRLTLRPERDGFATVEVAIAEREAVPSGTAAWAVTAVQAGVDREATVAVPGFTGQGDAWSASWRWWANRPAVSIGFAAPQVHGWPGVWRVEGGWQSDAFSFVGGGVAGPDQVVQETRAHAGLSVTDWLNGSLRYSISAGFDSWNGDPAGEGVQVVPRHDQTRAIAAGGSLEQRLFADRVSLAGTFTRWTPVSAGAPFSAAGATASARSSAEPAGWVLTGNAGAQWVGDAAPMGLWPGAGTGHAREPLLRAHPLLEDGIIDVTGSTVFGRTLAFGGVEVQRWLERPALAHVAIAGFIDAARATRQASVATPGQFDLGLGMRVRMPGSAGLLRIDVARGMRDGARALTVGIMK
jgi:Peptidase_C39 like family